MATLGTQHLFRQCRRVLRTSDVRLGMAALVAYAWSSALPMTQFEWMASRRLLCPERCCCPRYARLTGKPEVNVFPMGTKPIQIPACEFVARTCRELATAFSERGATQLNPVR